MKKIPLIPYLDACHFDEDVELEMQDHDVSTHYQDDTFYINWKDDDDFPKTKEWLIETYGEDIKNYNIFAFSAT